MNLIFQKNSNSSNEDEEGIKFQFSFQSVSITLIFNILTFSFFDRMEVATRHSPLSLFLSFFHKAQSTEQHRIENMEKKRGKQDLQRGQRTWRIDYSVPIFSAHGFSNFSVGFSFFSSRIRFDFSFFLAFRLFSKNKKVFFVIWFLLCLSL